MTTLVTNAPANPQVALNRLVWIGPLAIIGAILANTIVWQIAVVVLQPDPQFVPFVAPVPIVFTFLGVLGAVLVFAVIGRISKNPIPLFRRVALIALLVSLIPDVLMLLTGFNPGTTLPNVLVLMLMHIIAYAIAVNMLTRWSRA